MNFDMRVCHNQVIFFQMDLDPAGNYAQGLLIVARAITHSSQGDYS